MKFLMGSLLLLVLVSGAHTASADAAADFSLHCAKCHGSDGKGQTTIGKIFKVPDFTVSSWSSKTSSAQIRETIENGAKDASGKQLMPSFKEKLSAEQINALVEYVQHFSAQSKGGGSETINAP